MLIGHKMSCLSSTLQKGCCRFRSAAAATAAAWDNGDLWSPLLQKAQKGISLWDLHRDQTFGFITVSVSAG